jgi:hypothetical protein
VGRKCLLAEYSAFLREIAHPQGIEESRKKVYIRAQFGAGPTQG